MLELAARQLHALGQPDEAVPAPGSANEPGAATPTARRLTTSTTSALPACAEIATSTAAPGACLRALVRPSWTMR